MYLNRNNPLDLKSGISKEYKKHFLLDGDSLRRVVGILEESASGMKEKTRIYFRVEREDDRFYETEDISQVLADPNVNSKMIMSIEIFLDRWKEKEKDDEGYYKNLVSIRYKADAKETYSDRNVINIEIASEDTNWSLVLADRIEPQIVRVFKKSRIPKWLFLIYLLPLIMISFKNADRIDWIALSSYSFPLFFIFMFLLMFFIVRDRYPKWVTRITGPESVFYWGDFQSRYDIILRTRNNIFWVVIVGFVVSMLTGVVLMFF